MSPKVTIGKTAVEVEIADSVWKKTKGLMFRDRLEKGRGMLFVFGNDSTHPFWMFGMRFAIDMVWMDKEGKVVHIEEDARPCRLFCRLYRSRRLAKYVLEVNSGFVKRERVKVGDKIKIELT